MLGAGRASAMAVVLAILLQSALAPFCYFDVKVGLDGPTMMAQIAVDLTVFAVVNALIFAVRRSWRSALVVAAMFGYLYSVASQLMVFLLTDPTSEIRSSFAHTWGMMLAHLFNLVFMLVLTIVPSLLLARFFRNIRGIRAMLRPRECWRCEYSLEGLPEPVRCPECGTVRGPRWLSRPLFMLFLGDQTAYRRARTLLAVVALLLVGGWTARLAWVRAPAPAGVRLASGEPATFAEVQNGSPPPPRLGKAIDVTQQFGLIGPFKLKLVMSLEGEQPPRAQLLLMHTTPAFGGVGMEGIAFGELTAAQRDQIRTGEAPPMFLVPVTKHISRYQRAIAVGGRHPNLSQLWPPPPSFGE